MTSLNPPTSENTYPEQQASLGAKLIELADQYKSNGTLPDERQRGYLEVLTAHLGELPQDVTLTVLDCRDDDIDYLHVGKEVDGEGAGLFTIHHGDNNLKGLFPARK